MQDELMGVNAPQLEDDDNIDYSKREKKVLDDIAVPVLDDGYVDTIKVNNALEGISAPVFSDDFVNTDKKASALDGIEAASLSDDTYIEEKKSSDLSDIQGAVLDEPEVKREYKPKFNTEDIEAIKKEAKERAVKQALSDKPSGIDEKRSREMYLALMEEQKIKAAKKGFIISIVLMFCGIAMSIILYLFTSITEFKPDIAGIDMFKKISQILSFVSGGASVLLLIKSKAMKSFASFIFGLMVIANLVCGGYMLIAKEGNFIVNFIMLLAILVLNIAISFVLGSSEPVDLYYTRKDV